MEYSSLNPTTRAFDVSVMSHITDVHCHPTDSATPADAMESLSIKICAMATRASDQLLVRRLAEDWPDKVTPCFGYHPWFVHWIALESPRSKVDHYSSLFLGPGSADNTLNEAFAKLLPLLPEPILLTDVLADLRSNLSAFPTAMLGEVGIDRACRIPFNDPTSLEAPSCRDLSPFTIPLDHQLAVLEAQLALAVELGRSVSLHSVKCQKPTMELLDRMHRRHGKGWSDISVDLHSCGLSAEMWRDIEKKHTNVYLSLSTAINSRSPAHRTLIAACSPQRILVESDFHDVRHAAGRTMDMVRIVADVKRWSVEDVWKEHSPVDEEQWGAVRKLEQNWTEFQRGKHKPRAPKASRKVLLLNRDYEELESDSDGS